MLLNDKITIETSERWNVTTMIVRAIEVSHAAFAQMSLDEILNLPTDVFSFSSSETLRLFSNISMYSHYVHVTLYSTRATRNDILHQKDVDRLNFITTVVRITVYYILQEYGCKDLPV